MAGAGASAGDDDGGACRLLLAQGVRPLAGVVVVLAVVVIIVSGLRYADADQHAPGWVDLTLDGFIRGHVRPDLPVIQVLAGLGDPAPAAVLVTALAGAAAVARWWSGVLVTLVGTLGAVTVTEVVLKPLIGRLSYGHLSFPSGHTTVVVALAVSAVILLAGARWPRSGALRLGAGVAAVMVAAGVAVALIAERSHYASDTLAGACVALASVLSVALALDLTASLTRAGSGH